MDNFELRHDQREYGMSSVKHRLFFSVCACVWRGGRGWEGERNASILSRERILFSVSDSM